MKTIIGKRCSGKTTALLHQIYKDGYSHPVIVVPEATMARTMDKMVQNGPFKYKPQVMTFKDYIHYCNGKSEITSYGDVPTFYFDNLEMCLQVTAPKVTVCAPDDHELLTYENMSGFISTLARPLNTYTHSISSIGGMTINSDEEEYIRRDNKAILEYLRSAYVSSDYKMHIESYDEKPHIDRVKFNGPATIVFWKDGTKTVVKFDKKGVRNKKLAVLYAFIRKIYGEGRNYHYILDEIEKACK